MGCSWLWHLPLLALMHGEGEPTARCFGGTRPALHLARGSTSVSLQHPKAAQQTLHCCWERGKKNQCCAPERYLLKEVSSDLLSVMLMIPFLFAGKILYFQSHSPQHTSRCTYPLRQGPLASLQTWYRQGFDFATQQPSHSYLIEHLFNCYI